MQFDSPSRNSPSLDFSSHIFEEWPQVSMSLGNESPILHNDVILTPKNGNEIVEQIEKQHRKTNCGNPSYAQSSKREKKWRQEGKTKNS